MRKDPKYKEMMVISEQETELFTGDGVSFEMKFHVDLEQTDAEQLEIAFRCGKERPCAFWISKKRKCMWIEISQTDGAGEGQEA